MRIFKLHTALVSGVTFSPDGALLASGSEDGSIRLWESTTGRQHALLFQGRSQNPYTSAELLAFSPDGRWLATWGQRSGLRIWDVPAGTLRTTLLADTHAFYGRTLAFAPAGKRFVANRWVHNPDGYVLRCWDTTAWTERQPLVRTAGYEAPPIYACAFDPSGSRLACGNGQVLDARNGRELARLNICYSAIHICWCHGRPLLAACSGDDGWAIHICDPDTGRPIARVQPPARQLKGLAFTPDGRLLLTASDEQTARVWDTTTWTECERLNWKIGKLQCLAVSPDGMRAAAGGTRGKIVVWDLD
jgi:WD40 repeat protein